MINEVSAKPMHPSNFLPDWECSEQIDSKNQVSNTPKSDDAEYRKTQDEISGRRRKWKNECFHYNVKGGT